MTYGSKGAYPFAEKKARYRKYTNWDLAFARADIIETIANWPDGPNAAWYADDLHTVCEEMSRREAEGAACPHCGR